MAMWLYLSICDLQEGYNFSMPSTGLCALHHLTLVEKQPLKLSFDVDDAFEFCLYVG